VLILGWLPLLHAQTPPPVPVVISPPVCPREVEAGPGANLNGGDWTNGWFALGGGGLYLLRPYAQDNTAFRTTYITSGTVGGVATSQGQTTNKNFAWTLEPAGAFWLGVTSPCGFGFRGRYFFFNSASQDAVTSLTPFQAASLPGAATTFTSFISPSPFTPAFLPGALPPAAAGQSSFGSPSAVLLLPSPNGEPGIGQDVLRFTSNLHIDAVDAEPTYLWENRNWSVLAGAGARYLHFQQGYRGSLVNDGGGFPISETQLLEISKNFRGGGPTVSGQLTWRIAQTGVALYASARGSLLVGKADQFTRFTEVINDPTGISGVPGTPVFSRTESSIPNSTDMVLPVAEFELGFEYGLTLFDNRWFFRASAVNQTYFGVGNAAGGNNNLSLLGCQLGLGVNF
jgi:hypothetical protein